MIKGLEIIPVALFSLPEEAFQYEPGAEEVVTCFKNGSQERKIYSNTELTPVELEWLKTTQAEARRQGKKFMPSVAGNVMRYVTRSRGDPKKVLKEMQATQDWRLAFFRDGPISDESVMEDMQHGVVYFGARDCCLRPALIIRPGRIPPSWLKGSSSNRLLRLLVFSMEYMVRYMCLPGHVETAVLIIDLNGVTLSQVPLGSVREMIKVLSQHYIYRVHKFYICNVPRSISRMSSALMALLTDRQKQKIHVLRSPEDIRQSFALHHLETDLGGERPMITRFFPFPLEAGPFRGNDRSGANSYAIANLHEAVTEAGFRGHVWDPACSHEENTQIDYAEHAECLSERHRRVLPRLIIRKMEDSGMGQKLSGSNSTETDVKPESHSSKISVSSHGSVTTEAGTSSVSTEAGTNASSQQMCRASTTTDDDLVDACEISLKATSLWNFCMPTRNTCPHEHRIVNTTSL